MNCEELLILKRGVEFGFSIEEGLPILEDGKHFKAFLRNHSLSWKKEAKSFTVNEDGSADVAWSQEDTKDAPLEKLVLEICDEDSTFMAIKNDAVFVVRSSMETDINI